MDSDALGQQAMLQDMVLDSADVQEFLTRLAKAASRVLGGPDTEVFCGVTLLRNRSKATVASSSEHAQHMDEVQYKFDDGPCLRAAREGKTYVVRDFEKEHRFRDYADAISAHSIRSSIGVPIPLEGEAHSALNFYSSQPDAFDATAIAAAEQFAAEASSSLRLAVRIAELGERAGHMKQAMESRTIIDLAVGVVMAQNRCSQEEAIDILKRTSSARNVKLRDLAESVVSSVSHGQVATHFESAAINGPGLRP